METKHPPAKVQHQKTKNETKSETVQNTLSITSVSYPKSSRASSTSFSIFIKRSQRWQISVSSRCMVWRILTNQNYEHCVFQDGCMVLSNDSYRTYCCSAKNIKMAATLKEIVVMYQSLKRDWDKKPPNLDRCGEILTKLKVTFHISSYVLYCWTLLFLLQPAEVTKRFPSKLLCQSVASVLLHPMLLFVYELIAGVVKFAYISIVISVCDLFQKCMLND